MRWLLVSEGACGVGPWRCVQEWSDDLSVCALHRWWRDVSDSELLERLDTATSSTANSPAALTPGNRLQSVPGAAFLHRCGTAACPQAAALTRPGAAHDPQSELVFHPCCVVHVPRRERLRCILHLLTARRWQDPALRDAEAGPGRDWASASASATLPVLTALLSSAATALSATADAADAADAVGAGDATPITSSSPDEEDEEECTPAALALEYLHSASQVDELVRRAQQAQHASAPERAGRGSGRRGGGGGGGGGGTASGAAGGGADGMALLLSGPAPGLSVAELSGRLLAQHAQRRARDAQAASARLQQAVERVGAALRLGGGGGGGGDDNALSGGQVLRLLGPPCRTLLHAWASRPVSTRSLAAPAGGELHAALQLAEEVVGAVDAWEGAVAAASAAHGTGGSYGLRASAEWQPGRREASLAGLLTGAPWLVPAARWAGRHTESDAAGGPAAAEDASAVVVQGGGLAGSVQRALPALQAAQRLRAMRGSAARGADVEAGLAEAALGAGAACAFGGSGGGAAGESGALPSLAEALVAVSARLLQQQRGVRLGAGAPSGDHGMQHSLGSMPQLLDVAHAARAGDAGAALALWEGPLLDALLGEARAARALGAAAAEQRRQLEAHLAHDAEAALRALLEVAGGAAGPGVGADAGLPAPALRRAAAGALRVGWELGPGGAASQAAVLRAVLAHPAGPDATLPGAGQAAQSRLERAVQVRLARAVQFRARRLHCHLSHLPACVWPAVGTPQVALEALQAGQLWGGAAATLLTDLVNQSGSQSLAGPLALALAVAEACVRNAGPQAPPPTAPVRLHEVSVSLQLAVERAVAAAPASDLNALRAALQPALDVAVAALRASVGEGGAGAVAAAQHVADALCAACLERCGRWPPGTAALDGAAAAWLARHALPALLRAGYDGGAAQRERHVAGRAALPLQLARVVAEHGVVEHGEAAEEEEQGAGRTLTQLAQACLRAHGARSAPASSPATPDGERGVSRDAELLGRMVEEVLLPAWQAAASAAAPCWRAQLELCIAQVRW